MAQLILTADPGFAHLALEEFRRDSIGARPLAELASGVWLVDCDEGFWGLAETWIDDPPIFARHICPVDIANPLIGTPRDLARLSLAAVAEYADLLDAEVSFSVQSRIFVDLPYKPFDINRSVAAALEEAANSPLDVRQPFQVLSVLCAAVDQKLATPAKNAGAPQALLGLSLASHNISDWAGGVRRFRREKDRISRAEFKLLEAIEAFHIEPPSGGVAVDLGAAPGGWTRVLRQKGQYVTAVDPAMLHPLLAADRGVRHKRMSAEAYLREGPDTYDLLVNDMRMDAVPSARLTNAFADFLYPHAEALLTLKLGQSARQLDPACAVLRERFTILHMRQLFHNRNEVTIHLKAH